MADPILDKVVQTLSQLRATKPADFKALKPEEIDQYIREETQGKYGIHDLNDVSVRNVGRSLLQGLTMNWGDELLGKLPASMGGGADAENETRMRGDLFHRAHPVVDVASQMVGGAAPMLLAPEAEGASLLGQIGRGAAIGATSGAVSGAGAGEDTAGRVTGGAVGGLLGGAVGAAIPAGAGLLKYMRDPEAAAAARVAGAVAKSGGARAVAAKAREFAANGRGDQVMLGDLSPHLRSATDFAATNSEDTFNATAQKLAGRNADASDRILQDTRGLGAGDPLNITTDANAEKQGVLLAGARKSFADGPDGYNGLRAANPDFDITHIQKALTKPTVVSAWKQARLAGDLAEDSPLDKMLQKLLKANPGVDRGLLTAGMKQGAFGNEMMNLANSEASARPVTFDDLQALKRTLDGSVTTAYARGNGALAKSYSTIRDAVNEALEAGSPGFKGINSTYRQMKGLENALQDGVEAWDQVDTRGLATRLSSMTKDEAEQFRLGMASRFIAKLRSVGTNRNQAAEIVNGSPAMHDKLAVVFGDAPTFEKFIQRAEAEAQLHKLNAAVGGSATARRLQAANVSPGELGIDLATKAVKGGLLSAVVSKTAGAAKGALVRGTAREMGPQLLTQGTPAIEKFLSQMGQTEPLVNGFFSKVLPAAAPRARGLLDPNQ